jgi:hypothetical protein
MTVTSIAEELHTASCAICARPARRGAKLCTQCKAAVKRARQVPSVHSEFLPQVVAPTKTAGPVGGRDRSTMPARRATRVGLPPVPGGWGIYATLIAFGAAVSITGYFATDKQEEDSNRERVTLAARASSMANAGNDGGTQAQSSAARRAAEEGATEDDVIAQIEWTVPPVSPVRSPGALSGRKPVRDTRTPDPMPLTIDSRSLNDEPKSEPVAQTVAALPVIEPLAPPTPDRWQVLASAMSRCERESLLAGFLCKERARLQFCEGHWGEAPQCPSGALSNNSR